ncbi:MAG: DUF5522 domain-containing protein [Pyrinomonadaceae bacterium]
MSGRERVQLTEGEDFYWDGALMVFTARFHLRRGYCCENDCRHCPYKNAATTQTDARADALACEMENCG